MSNLTADDRKVIEQQLKELLSTGITMEQFPAEEAEMLGLLLDRPDWMREVCEAGMPTSPILKGPTLTPAQAMREVTTGRLTSKVEPIMFYCGVIENPWQDCLDAAHQWFLEHMGVDQARKIFEALTDEHARLSPPHRLDLDLAVHCGLKMGLPSHVHKHLAVRDGLGPIDTHIRIEEAVRLQWVSILRAKVLADHSMVVLNEYEHLDLLGQWLPVFQLTAAWWDNGHKPKLPKIPVEG